MGSIEENKQIVQQGLNKRAEARREALADEKHEKITAAMFKVVNDHAKARVYNAPVVYKKTKRNKKRIASAKRNGNVIVKSFWRSIMLLITSGLAHAIGITELWMLLLIFMLIFNTYRMWKNAAEIANLM